MMGRLTLAGLTCLALAGCGSGAPEANRAEAAAEPTSILQTGTPTPTTSPTESIMRPAVVNEVEPAPPPPPKPVEAIVHFESGAALSDEAKAALEQIAATIAATPGAVVIRGHTDSKGSDADNKRMSEKRAEAVRDYLAEHGVAKDRMTLYALGETRPVAPNATPEGQDDPEGRLKNRRVTVELEKPAPAPSPAPSSEPAPAANGAAAQK